ncbi:Nuclear intron maturase 3, mitochondrial, partial [Linum grandiflorum]
RKLQSSNIKTYISLSLQEIKPSPNQPSFLSVFLSSVLLHVSMLRRTRPICSQLIKSSFFSSALPLRNSDFHHLQENPTEPLSQTQLKSLVLSHCSYGKFYNLIQKVVSLPPVLLSASQNLIPPDTTAATSPKCSLHQLVSKRLSVEAMGCEIFDNRLDIDSHCVKFAGKGDCLVLPDLKLKVLIEAIRMVLEIVYDDRFVTFSYGGRVNMGRHTAIRYLKNSVENPSWWFRVHFERQEFDSRNVELLCLILEDKVKDKVLISLIKRLFDSGVLRIELGGLYLGRGFPQECGLCSILINVYFNGFDKEIQELRLQLNRENPRTDIDDYKEAPSPLYRPVKMYAVRYLDEILVITSGPKKLAIGLKSRFLKILESDFQVNVNKGRTIIHSAVSEKMNFIGFGLQAVRPSVLHPPMSEKAIRARKKYLRQKEVKALELKNARERNRKKLGLKILRHVVKKAKQSNGFKSDFEAEIGNEVQQIFAVWADETVKEFLSSLDERWTWHRLLTSGSFLNLKHIREMLPQELVESYDKFQRQVEKHLSPVKERKAREEAERRTEEAEEKRYAERTVDDLTKLSMKVSAPIELIREAVRMAGFTNNMGRPRPIHWLTNLEDADIIKWYAGVGERWLDFFCCCHNFKMVKTINLLGANPDNGDKWVSGMGAIHDSLHQICLPLCPDHISDLYTGKISLQDIDCSSFVDVD